MLRLRSTRVVELPVSVQVPCVAQGVSGIGVARAGAVEVNGQRHVATERVGGRDRGRNVIRGIAREVDPADVAPDHVGVVEVAARPGREVDGKCRVALERLDVRAVREPVAAGEHRPDALARVVREEERPVVGRRERSSLRVEPERRDHRPPGGVAVLARYDAASLLDRQSRARPRSRPHRGSRTCRG